MPRPPNSFALGLAGALTFCLAVSPAGSTDPIYFEELPPPPPEITLLLDPDEPLPADIDLEIVPTPEPPIAVELIDVDVVPRPGKVVNAENAVGNALAWLAAHQEADGGWSFRQSCNHDAGRCNHPGTLPDARHAATGLVLLASAGAGQTHWGGAYKDVVRRGLRFLLLRQKENGEGSLWEPSGGMASHGMATLALCEFYALTYSKEMLDPAQRAIEFSVASQDPVHGGWGYAPRERGDTPTFGWQLLALRSGHMAYLKVPPATIQRCSSYLDSVEAREGTRYGFRGPATRREDTTAIGLASRMWLGWRSQQPAMKSGWEYLAQRGPSSDLQSNYFASQLMNEMGGDEWRTWITKLRDQLVSSQEQAGPTKGSWHLASDPAARAGGRVYCTALAALLLEIRTHKWPRRNAEKDDFEL